MLKIRKNVFETNSSSSHSISISNDKTQLYESISPDENGEITIVGGEFGWEYVAYFDSITKANYCAIDCESHSLNLAMLEEVLLEHTGAKKIIFDINGYVDHQSIGTSREAFDSKEKLKDFIFNPASVLFTGNDNSSPPPNFYDNPNAIYRYEGKIESISNSVKFETKPHGEALEKGITNLFYSDDNRYDDEYRFYDHEFDTISGVKFSSFDDIKNNKIILYKVEAKYITNDSDKKSKYIGNVVLDTKVLKFTVEKIKNVKKPS